LPESPLADLRGIASDHTAALTAAELIIDRGFACGRPLTALIKAFLAG
jgi:hypothetical protein